MMPVTPMMQKISTSRGWNLASIKEYVALSSRGKMPVKSFVAVTSSLSAFNITSQRDTQDCSRNWPLCRKAVWHLLECAGLIVHRVKESYVATFASRNALSLSANTNVSPRTSYTVTMAMIARYRSQWCAIRLKFFLYKLLSSRCNMQAIRSKEI